MTHSEFSRSTPVKVGADTALRVGALILAALGVAGCVHYSPKPLPQRAAAASAFQARTLESAGLRQFMEQSTGTNFQQWPLPSLGFEELALAAVYYHPSLDVARAQWSLSRAGKQVAAGRPNPTLSLLPGYDWNPGKGISPWFPALNLDWPIETAGKRGLRIAHAAFLAESARLGVHQTVWQVRTTLHLAYLDWLILGERQRLLQRQAELENGVLEVLEQRFQAGAVSRLEIEPFRLHRLKGMTDLAEIRRSVIEAKGRVAEAIGVPGSVLPEPRSLELGAVVSNLQELGDVRGLQQKALQNRADVLALLAEYAASEAGLKLEIAKQYPDLRLGTGYQWDQGDHKWTIGLSLELPVLNQNRGPIQEALARRDEVGARFTALQTRVLGEVERAAANLQASREQVDRVEETLRTYRQHVEHLKAAFTAGGADQLDVRTAELESATTELSRLDAFQRWHQAVADLEQQIQNPLSVTGIAETHSSASNKP